MIQLTIFTPTLNRKHLLPRLYQSLINQTNKDFIWMVIDDGSSDGTETLIQGYIDENILEIKYFWKKNEGMHSAHNLAYEKITTEWNTCIDSDDMMPENAVETIIGNLPRTIAENCYGLVGLDANFNFKLLGQKFPAELRKVKMMELQKVHHITGDKKLVFKTKIVRDLPPYPIFEGEKLVPLSYKSFEAEERGFFLETCNEILCLVEYQSSGSTKNRWSQYRKNPNGFAFLRLKKLNTNLPLKEKFKNALHLGSSVFFTKKFTQLFKNKYPFTVLALLPAGFLLNLIIRFKTYKGR